VRKKYKTFVSTVSVLEKVILRWRRKGQGLRGFRAEQPAMTVAEEEDDDVDFDDDEATRIFRRQKVDEALKEAVSRVLSMVDSPDARMQYRRMLEEFRQATVRSFLA
jgi:calmodulin-binding transcription activator